MARRRKNRSKRDSRVSKKRILRREARKYLASRRLHLDKQKEFNETLDSTPKRKLAKKYQQQLEIPVKTVTLKEYQEQGFQAYRKQL